MRYQDFLATIDDGHSMTTAKEHIAEICRVAEKMPAGLIVELGSHAGISAAALAMASPWSVVVSVDLCDTVSERQRVEYWASLGVGNIIPVACSAAEYLASMEGPADLIFHDADHGERVVPEYMAAAAKCRALAIHDWEQLSFESQQAVMSLFETWWYPEPDARGRFLWIGRNA